MRKKLKKHGRALAKVDDEHRHQVRKDAKKLRYGAEFFGSLCDANNKTRRHRKFLAAMSTMQDCLGDLNDLATGAGCAQRAWTGKPLARDTVISHADKDALIVAAQGAVDDVLDAKLLALTGLLQGWPARRVRPAPYPVGLLAGGEDPSDGGSGGDRPLFAARIAGQRRSTPEPFSPAVIGFRDLENWKCFCF